MSEEGFVTLDFADALFQFRGRFFNLLGEGDRRSAASEITADYIQFVPAVPGKLNNFRFERQSNGTWRAVLEWPAKSDKPARQKIYIMESWKP